MSTKLSEYCDGFLENRGFAFRIGTSCALLQAGVVASGAIHGA
jgi:hypothetical protein